jgi:hypothetical protein
MYYCGAVLRCLETILFPVLVVCHVKSASPIHAHQLNLSHRHVIVHSIQHPSDMVALGFEIYMPGNTACNQSEKQKSYAHRIIHPIGHLPTNLQHLSLSAEYVSK